MPYSFCTNVEWFKVLLLILILIAAALGIVTIIYGIKQSVLSIHKHLASLKAFLITYYITCLLWIIGIIGYIISAILPYTKRCNDVMLFTNIGTLMGFNGYAGGLICVYLLFLLRLKYLFVDHAVLKLSNCKFYWLMSGVIIQTGLFIASSYYHMTLNWVIGGILLYAFTITNAIYWLVLLLTFLRCIAKLQRLSLMQQSKQHQSEHTVAEIQNNESTQRTVYIEHFTLTPDRTSLTTVIPSWSSDTGVTGSSLTEQSTHSMHRRHRFNYLAECVVKYSICVFFAFLSTMIANTMAFYRGFINDTFQLLMIHITFIMWDFFLNILCLHLQFLYAKKCYFKLCGCLRRKFKSYALGKFDNITTEIEVLNKSQETE